MVTVAWPDQAPGPRGTAAHHEAGRGTSAPAPLLPKLLSLWKPMLSLQPLLKYLLGLLELQGIESDPRNTLIATINTIAKRASQ